MLPVNTIGTQNNAPRSLHQTAKLFATLFSLSASKYPKSRINKQMVGAEGPAASLRLNKKVCLWTRKRPSLGLSFCLHSKLASRRLFIHRMKRWRLMMRIETSEARFCLWIYDGNLFLLKILTVRRIMLKVYWCLLRV